VETRRTGWTEHLPSQGRALSKQQQQKLSLEPLVESRDVGTRFAASINGRCCSFKGHLKISGINFNLFSNMSLKTVLETPNPPHL
jgi:hypothetical protein